MALDVFSAKATLDSIEAYKNTKPAQSNRGRFRDVVANGARGFTETDRKQLGLTNQDIGNAMSGRPVDIEASRRTPIIDFLQIKSERVLNFS